MTERPGELLSSLEQNMNLLSQLYADNDCFVIRYLDGTEASPQLAIAYLSVLVDEERLNELNASFLNHGLQRKDSFVDEALALEWIKSLGGATELQHIDVVVQAIADSNAVVFIDGYPQAFGVSLPGYATRSIDEPTLEVNVRGPREGFIEDIQKNLGMVLRRLKTPELKILTYQIGKQTSTKVMAMYLQNQAEPSTVDEVKRRLAAIQMNVLVDSAQIEEWIQDSTFSPFAQIMNTERPDRIATALNQGKIAIMTDGTPNVLIVPTTFFDLLHPSEDLYERFYFANFLRVLRVFTFFLSLFAPSLYIALTTFHLEMIPTPLMLAFMATKAGVPFPTFIEAMLMEVVFEVLREASLRLPRSLGQSVSIVGALIIGEAAVQSGIVSRPVVIVVALTGIASFTMPSFNTAISLRILRFPIMFISASTGVFGLALCMFAIILHLCSLKSFGTLFLPTLNSLQMRNALEKYVLLPAPYRRLSKQEGHSHEKR
ncbi:spore germination protein [Paenibacillus aestuarii]|uniref:Spore germination protein n=1 Tax=Paenibacillus aestuarii TaxID=516965 RepID=A0ABW0KCW0_9BACL|nr:spore germination protein [Paenibacillus aestuarii]